MANVLITAFSYVIELFCVIMLFSNVFGTEKKMKHLILFGILIFSVPAIFFFAFDNFILNIITYTFANFLYACFFFKCSYLSAFVMSLVSISSLMGAEFISMSLTSLLFDVNITDYNSTANMYLIVVVINKTIYFLIFQVISIFKTLVEHKGKRKPPFFMLIYPFGTILACVLFWLMSYEYEFSRQINIFTIVVCVFFLISIVATYFLYNQTMKKEAEVYKLQAELEIKNIDEAYYKVLDFQNEELKTFIHDEKNHLSVIKNLSSVEEVEQYVDRIYDGLNKYSSSGKTNNKMLDLILNKYGVLCEKDGIDFYINIRTANLSFMENTDLTTMLSNILDNAIEAAKSTKEKTIDLSINHVSGNDLLTCVNSSDSKPVSVSGVLKTTKEDKNFHGMGIKSIKRIVSKYNGEYEWDYDEKEKEFTTYIMFPIHNK